ncbi:hypothetical protein V499_04130 [Pseudogymnoascus sp. VKM F-103]|nr:hypothetical protein V499_04130 [Pseudogymnoascus sp. VKM F-103]
MSTTEIESFPVGFLELPPSLDSFPTHDVSHVGAHVPSISTVVQLLQSLTDEDWKSRGQGRYSKAHVLLISWVDDDLGVLRELQDLETVFTNSFNYDVETWGIPRDKSQRRLQERVTQFVNDYEGNDSLLILYYAGHAIRANGGPVWTARQNPNPKMSAESIPVQVLLAECDSDALLLYDCCFATPIPASGNTCGVTEAIAACGFHETAPGVGEDSFTNALVNELGILSYSTTPISIGELYRRLVQRLRSDTLNVTFDRNGDIRLGLDGKPIFEGDRRRTPIYYPISNEQKRRKIMLAPLPSKVSGSTSPVTSIEIASETSFQAGSSKDDEEVNKCSNSTNVSNSQNTQLYPMVLLSIRVDSENLETQTWREWIRDIPTEATNITIQGIYRSCSTLLLLTMPIETWTLLPDNAAYSFLGFVTSSNLAPTLLSAAKSTIPVKEQSAITSPEDAFKKSSQFTALDDLALSKRDRERLEEMPQERLLELRQRTGDEEGSNVLETISIDESGSQVFISTFEDYISATKSATGPLNIQADPNFSQNNILSFGSFDPEDIVSAIPRTATPKVARLPEEGTNPQVIINISQEEDRKLFDHVIVAASTKSGKFPSPGSFKLGELRPSGESASYGLRSDQIVRAAGELYAYEILSQLETSLPGFGRDNWQSTIRNQVAVHENYRGLIPWKGRITADIMYNDTAGVFTKILIEHGYLDGAMWANVQPRYFFIVKTTTEQCSTRFFLSKSEYEMMQQMRLRKYRPSAGVCIIFRVFNLNKDEIDMCVYVDPIGMQESGHLEFRPGSYSVIPSASGGSKAAAPHTRGTQFNDRYGAGVELNLRNLNDADATT